jgi:hypothetical protein
MHICTYAVWSHLVEDEARGVVLDIARDAHHTHQAQEQEGVEQDHHFKVRRGPLRSCGHQISSSTRSIGRARVPPSIVEQLQVPRLGPLSYFPGNFYFAKRSPIFVNGSKHFTKKRAPL